MTDVKTVLTSHEGERSITDVPDYLPPSARQRLLVVLRERSRSQAWMARQIRMNETLLAHYLAGRRKLPGTLLPRIAEILDVSVEDILVEKPAA